MFLLEKNIFVEVAYKVHMVERNISFVLALFMVNQTTHNITMKVIRINLSKLNLFQSWLLLPILDIIMTVIEPQIF